MRAIYKHGDPPERAFFRHEQRDAQIRRLALDALRYRGTMPVDAFRRVIQHTGRVSERRAAELVKALASDGKIKLDDGQRMVKLSVEEPAK